MKRYEYVPLKISMWSGAPTADYRAIIDEYARMGYRYAGFLPTKQNGYGQVREMDLIFEKDQ